MAMVNIDSRLFHLGSDLAQTFGFPFRLTFGKTFCFTFCDSFSFSFSKAFYSSFQFGGVDRVVLDVDVFEVADVDKAFAGRHGVVFQLLACFLQSGDSRVGADRAVFQVFDPFVQWREGCFVEPVHADQDVFGEDFGREAETRTSRSHVLTRNWSPVCTPMNWFCPW